MPIAQITPLSAGTSLQVLLDLPQGAVSWRLLRRADADFSGPADPAAAVVACQPGVYSSWLQVTDYSGLTNGTAAFYQLYTSTDGKTFTADGPPASAVPAATYQDAGEADPQELLTARIIDGMATEVLAGNLVPGATAGGVIPVFTAPFALPDKLCFPCVTVHLDDTRDGVRFLGDDTALMFTDDAGDVVETEGWLVSFSFAVIGTCLNPDERIALRKALRRVIQANLSIFDAAGMADIGFSQADTEDFQAQTAPLYMTVGRFTCQAPLGVTAAFPPIDTLLITADIGTDQVHG